MQAASRLNNSERWPLGIMVVCGFEQHSLPAQLDVVRRLGASHVELYPRWSNQPDARGVGRQVREAGLEVWSAHGPWGNETWQAERVDLGSLDPAARQSAIAEVRRTLEWLALAGGSRLVVHPGVLSEPADTTQRRGALLDSLAALAPEAAGHGVFLCVENLPPGCFPGSHMADNAAIVAELTASHVGLCLDTGHANIVADVAGEARVAGRHLRTTHVHDNDGRRDEHLLPGLGTVRWAEFSVVLAEIGYDGVIMLECPRYLREHPEVITDELRDRLAELCRKPVRVRWASESFRTTPV
ncbi:MAG: sugar phosphate isomerase/epimerase [Planctomycetes bacterium]|nr:sugar phosphate isomerase/epimerase [Planctomycetota bacterium]